MCLRDRIKQLLAVPEMLVELSRHVSFPAGTAPLNVLPTRAAILHEGAKLTVGDRDKEYGPPRVNMSCAGDLKRVVRAHLSRAISPEEQEALDMVLTKISRYVTGTPKRDTFVDGATYFAILGELALEPQDDGHTKPVD